MLIRHCDKCKKELTGQRYFEVKIIQKESTNTVYPSTEDKFDFCLDCMVKFEKLKNNKGE